LGLDKGGDVCDYLKYTDDPTSIYKLPPLETVAFVPPKTITAADLQGIEFAPPDFIVDELFIPGCYLVVGKPKSKKSWLMLHVLLQVAKGGMVFGSFNATKHEALYLDLEGNENGISQRLKLMHLLNETWPAGLHFGFSETWNLRGVEALAQLDGYLTSNPKVRFVVIDVLQNFREPADPRTPAYAQDYNAIKPIQRLAHKHNVVICLIHHTRKAKSDDPFDEVSGTTGLTGAVDGTLIIKRSDKDKNATILETRFRNLPDDQMREIDDYLKSGRPVLGLRTATHAELSARDLPEAASLVQRLLSGSERGPCLDMLLLNAAAALVAAGVSNDLPGGIAAARNAIESGAAARTLECLRVASRS